MASLHPGRLHRHWLSTAPSTHCSQVDVGEDVVRVQGRQQRLRPFHRDLVPCPAADRSHDNHGHLSVTVAHLSIEVYQLSSKGSNTKVNTGRVWVGDKWQNNCGCNTERLF